MSILAFRRAQGWPIGFCGCHLSKNWPKLGMREEEKDVKFLHSFDSLDVSTELILHLCRISMV